MSAQVALAMFLCTVFFWLLLCMSNIQTILENPFLTYGRVTAEDDVNLDSLIGMETVSRSSRKKNTRRRFRASALAAVQRERESSVVR